MSDIIRETLIQSKIEVLERLRRHIDSEIQTYRDMLDKGEPKEIKQVPGL